MGDMNSAMREQVMLVVLLVLGLGETVPEHRESRASLRTLAEAAINAISNSVPGARQDSTTDSTTEPGVTTPSQADDVMGCRPDFFQVGDSCFYVSRNLLARNWVEAQIACMEMNSTLASVTSKEELQSIENNWKWSGGAEWEFENWRSGEPNGGGRENCMEMEASGLGLWNDADCSGFASRCNEVGHTACNHRPSAQPQRYVCGYSLKQQEAPEVQDCGIWTMKDVDNLAAQEETRIAESFPFIPILVRKRGLGAKVKRKENPMQYF